MNRLLTAMLLTAGASWSALAAPVDLAEAESFAKAWRGRSIRSARTVRSASGENRLHVVRYDGGGWAAVGSDDESAPLIAFSDNGEDLVEDARNPLWAIISRDAECRAKDALARRNAKSHRGRHKGWTARRSHGKSVLSARQEEGATASLAYSNAALEDVRVAPLIESRWNQLTANGYSDGPLCYNYYTPGNVYCGCVATMMAQVMRYHRWPESSVTPVTKACTYNGVATNLTMQGGVYDWDAMPLRPSGTTADASRREIGKLCSDVGIANLMQYGSGGSGAYSCLVKDSIVNVFGYAYARFINYDDNYYPFDLAQFKTILITNCDARKPVCLGIGSSKADMGHAVIADGYGYDKGAFYVHINGGWGGVNDAWYCPPDEIFAGGYDVIATAVYNIFPQTRGAIVSGRVVDHSGLPVEGAEVSFFTATTSGRGGNWETTTNVVATVTTDAQGIYAWIKGDENPTIYGVRASHLDRDGDRTVVAYRESLSVVTPSTFSIGTLDESGLSYSKPYAFRLGNLDAVDFTLDLRCTVPPADYVLISPHGFVADWEAYVAARRTAHPELTFAVKDADEIYAACGGADAAEQIRTFIRDRVAMGTKYVVLGAAWSDPATIGKSEESFVVAGQNGDKYGRLALSLDNTIPGFVRTFDGKAQATDYEYALLDDDKIPDVVVARIPLVPWPKADGSVPTFSEMIAGYGEKVRKVESGSFTGRHRYACAGAQLGASVARGSAYWPTERHAYADGYYDFFDPRHPDTATDGEIAARRRFRDYFAMLNPVKGAMVVPVGSSADDFLADAPGWEAIVAKCHGLEGEAYGTGLTDSLFRETSTLVKFGIFAMPCLTGRPDRSVTWNGWTNCRCPSMGVAAICNPNGGEAVGFHNTHDGAGKNDVALVTANGDPYATQYEGLLLEALCRKRLNAGEAWKTAHADYVNRFGTGTWHQWTAYESLLYGDPLIRLSAVDEAVCGAGAGVPRVLFR